MTTLPASLKVRDSPGPPCLLMIGATNVGKTHYGGQLLRRLQRQTGQLRMVGTPPDLSVFQEVCDCLADGRSAPHTSTNQYRESIWHVCSVDEILESELIWPDYKGEQVSRITERRHVTEPWVQRIQKSDGWLLFVRLSLLRPPEDVLGRPRSREQMTARSEVAPEAEANDNKEANEGERGVDLSVSPASVGAEQVLPAVALSDQARFVELLQALLFVKQVGGNAPLRHPSLLIALSCWDELPDLKREGGWEHPASLLRKRLPLLSQFIESHWEPDFVQVIGLSSLGKALDGAQRDPEFRDRGPERQGWCVLPDGTQSPDLTLPIARLIEITKRGMNTQE